MSSNSYFYEKVATQKREKMSTTEPVENIAIRVLASSGSQQAVAASNWRQAQWRRMSSWKGVGGKCDATKRTNHGSMILLRKTEKVAILKSGLQFNSLW